MTVGLNLLLVPMLGVVGLALAGAVGAWVNIALLGAILRATRIFPPAARVLGRIGRITLASACDGRCIVGTDAAS